MERSLARQPCWPSSSQAAPQRTRRRAAPTPTAAPASAAPPGPAWAAQPAGGGGGGEGPVLDGCGASDDCKSERVPAGPHGLLGRRRRGSGLHRAAWRLPAGRHLQDPHRLPQSPGRAAGGALPLRSRRGVHHRPVPRRGRGGLVPARLRERRRLPAHRPRRLATGGLPLRRGRPPRRPGALLRAGRRGAPGADPLRQGRGLRGPGAPVDPAVACRFVGHQTPWLDAVPVCDVAVPEPHPTATACPASGSDPVFTAACDGGACVQLCGGGTAEVALCEPPEYFCTRPCNRDADCPSRTICRNGSWGERVGNWKIPDIQNQDEEDGRDVRFCQLPDQGCLDENRLLPGPRRPGRLLRGLVGRPRPLHRPPGPGHERRPADHRLQSAGARGRCAGKLLRRSRRLRLAALRAGPGRDALRRERGLLGALLAVPGPRRSPGQRRRAGALRPRRLRRFHLPPGQYLPALRVQPELHRIPAGPSAPRPPRSRSAADYLRQSAFVSGL